MSGEMNEFETTDFLRKNRPVPPAPPADEYERLLLAAASAFTADRRVKKRRLAMAMAASVIVAVGLSFSMFGGKPAPGATDEQLDAFLDETIGFVSADRPVGEPGEPADYMEITTDSEEP